MYKRPYFSETNDQKVFAFMQEHNFVIVTAMGSDGPVATHVPVLVSRNEMGLLLEGHIMKNTDHHKAFVDNPHVLAIFAGPHCYVSASWYVDKKMASTWNYMTVHARGILEFLDEEQSKEILKKLTSHYEPPQSEASFEQLPAAYVDKMAKAIIGFKIPITSLDHVFKLSQNRDLISQKSIIEQLGRQGDAGALLIAAEMEKRLKED